MMRIFGGLCLVMLGGLQIETSPMLGVLLGLVGVVMILSGALATLGGMR